MAGEKKLLNSMTARPQIQQPIATDMFVPNHSGVSRHKEATGAFARLHFDNTFTEDNTFTGTLAVSGSNPQITFTVTSGGFPTSDSGSISWASWVSNSGVDTAEITAGDAGGYGYGFGTVDSPFYVEHEGITLSIVSDGSNTIWDTNGAKNFIKIQTATIVEVNGSGITVTGEVQATEQIKSPASSTSRASLNVPHGSAPTSPVNGDIWTTTSGLFVRINGVTVGPLT